MDGMIRKYACLLPAAVFASVLLAGCTAMDPGASYVATLHRLSVQAEYPDGTGASVREGVEVTASELSTGNTYTASTDSSGCAVFTLSEGFYNVTLSDRQGDFIFNGSADLLPVLSDTDISLELFESRVSPVVIREVYCGGCTKYPEEGTYAVDKYIILHNNSADTYFLDGLCFGVLDPYNAQASNVWVTADPETGATQYPDFLPIGETIWRFGGSGTDFPLGSGEDAVIAVSNASANQIQVGHVYVNIYVPDVNNGTGFLVPAKGRLTELSGLHEPLCEYMNERTTDEYTFYPGKSAKTIPEPNIHQHFVSMDIEFQRTTF